MSFHAFSSRLLHRPFASVLAAGLLLGVGAGCATGGGSGATATSSPLTGSGTAPTAFFAGRSTFDFVTDPSLEAADAVSNRSYWAGRIRDTIAGNLTQKGYQRVHGGKPNLLVAFHIIRKQGDETSVASNYQGYHLSAGQKAQANLSLFIPPSGSGTLIVDVIDPASKEIVFRTSKQTPINNLQTADARDKALDGIVANALSTVPARS